MRIGIGFDAHRFKEGRRLVIGGVEIAHARGLDGHSDADVLLHAVCDAMLGALALGDIGMHFPDSDPRYRGIAGTELLRSVTAMIRTRGFDVGNIDATIVAHEPRMAPHIGHMQEAIARVLGCGAERIGVKATTTEQMGFCGRGEGIAAMAVALIVRRGE
ncbi:MAG: 2-C-methyl-D-erythritol 2,4-cyclodiphosphate synthase [Candidatus Aureabacteria bacterium]|nr:2-C-methyl-D-erythritol 2,4-cyclodiphosphate synthase [Candidatus Auribacterota bacterium]